MAVEITKGDMIPDRNRLFCPMERTMTRVFFSLVDYRNNYFTSNDPNKIIEFYNGFENRDQLIQWMKERPKGVANVHEVEGDKDIIVVIPTADFNVKYAKECRENIFKGLHIIFVESGGLGDFYFNFAHNVNIAIKKAKEYDSKWVVFSADDRYKIDDISKLICELESSEELSVLLYPNLLPMSSFSHYVGKLNTMGRAIRYILTHIPIMRKKISIYRTILLEKLSVDYNFALPGKLNNVLFTNNRRHYYGDIEVFILPRTIIEKLGNELLFDDHFINGMEDHDILLRLSSLNISYKKINYEIGLYYNSSLGASDARYLRDAINFTYFSYKLDRL